MKMRAREHVREALKHLAQVATNIETFSVSNGKIQTLMQTIHALKFSPELSSIVEIVVTHAFAAERRQPGAFYTFIRTLLSDPHFLIEDDSPNVSRVSEKPNERLKTRFATTLDFEDALKEIPERLSSLIKTSLDLSGFGGRIIVEKSRSKITSVELINGYSFSVKPQLSLNSSFNEPRILCIDGFIESVSEIHALLETSSGSNVALLLFIRGLSNDVLNTLKINFDRGSLRVLPVLVPFDFEGINTLVDIATVVGCDVISSNKGQLISTLTFADATMIPKASLFPDKALLINSKSVRAVSLHAAALKNKRAKEQEETLLKLIDARLRSLSPKQVVIRLPDDINYVIDAQTIDVTLRQIKSLIEHGVSLDGDVKWRVGQIEAAKCVETLRSLGSLVSEQAVVSQKLQD